MGLINKIRDIKRFQKIITVFLEQGFGHLVSEAHLSRYVPFSKKINKKQTKDSMPVRIRKAFEILGPTFVKLG